MKPHATGTRGVDQMGTVVWVVRAVEVKGVKGTIYRYWVTEDRDVGFLRLLDIGQFVASEAPVENPKSESEYVSVMIPACESVPMKDRRGQ